MYLSKLELLGFKSFQQKTNVNFTKGMTAIVGPNGCGKTNIVDALRWCLGEQKSSTLRSDKMENVIFNGTANKKPMGMAEVSLTIQNDKGVLPTEYSEVVITRRIFRSGESEYLLNKNICRLKDITNLFMDTGMGANAYSVIELKMVESILNNKTDERRVMFEEAAGVNKYKLRRRLTLKKLDDVKADLDRVNDIVSEVEKKVNSLERQAKRADKYNNLSSTLRELEIDLTEREYSLFNKQKQEAIILKEEALKTRINIDSELAQLEDELTALKSELNSLDTDLREKRISINHQTELIHKHQQEISVSEERKKSLLSNIEKFKAEIVELQQQLSITKFSIEEFRKKIDETSTNISNKISEKENYIDVVNEQKQLVDEHRKNVRQFSESLKDDIKKIADLENALSNAQNSVNQVNGEIEKLNSKIQNLSISIAKSVGYIEELQNDKFDVENKLAEAEKIYTEKQNEKERIEKELRELRIEEVNQSGLLSSVKDKIKFLQNLIDNLEGFSKGAKSLLENKSWQKNDAHLLANLGSAGEEFRFALEAALKNNLNNIIVASIDEAAEGINYLRNAELGKAAFLAAEQFVDKKSFLENIEAFILKRQKKKIAREIGFISWAFQKVVCDNQWIKFFERILENIVIVKSLEDALHLSKKYSRINFVTLSGDFIQTTGVIEAGSLPSIDNTLFGRKQLLDNLISSLPEEENKLEKLREKILSLEKQDSEIDLKIYSERGRILINDLANVEKQIAQFEFEKKKAQDEVDKTHQELQELAIRSNILDKEREATLSELTQSKVANAVRDKEFLALEDELHKIEEEYNRRISHQNLLNLEFERLIGEKKNYENSLLRAEENIASLNSQVSKRQTDIENFQNESVEIEQRLILLNTELEQLLLDRESLRNSLEEVENNFNVVKENINGKESLQNGKRKEREKLTDRIHESDLHINEFNLKMDNLIQHIDENYSLRIDLKEFDDLDTFDFTARSQDVHTLKQQIKNLGPINLLAYSEYDEEKQRLDFLLKQRNDLVESEKDLAKTIEEINNTAQQLFLETFEKIRNNFISLFRKLFNPGDEADLRLEEGVDPLEGKIEIIAKPKGKRPTSIELLSGGEKTLTAIALLFSIYLVKPSPFCILDEIDAPLDDANIDRFSKILRDFSDNTQFIVVTHNKRTMEASDVMYGVTMQEEGVSKLVSVLFNEDMNFVN